jgi:nonsense-mediated mRNA decay protein 3
MAAFAAAPMGSMIPGTVLCCLCGTSIAPNPAAMCANCIRSQVDITEGIQKQCTVLWCKECNRWLNVRLCRRPSCASEVSQLTPTFRRPLLSLPSQPPKAWVRADLESKELLTFCVKKVKGLNKVKLVDAGFLWTEPHSRRLKVKVSIQKEVLNGAILQQTFVVEVCEACQGGCPAPYAARRTPEPLPNTLRGVALTPLCLCPPRLCPVRGGAPHV